MALALLMLSANHYFLEFNAIVIQDILVMERLVMILMSVQPTLVIPMQPVQTQEAPIVAIVIMGGLVMELIVLLEIIVN